MAEFLRDNFNHFTLVRMMWSFVYVSDDFMCLIHVKRICKSKTFHCCVKGDMYIILWFTENVMLWNLLFAIQTICQLWKYLEPLPILTFRWRRDFSKTFFGPTYNFICYLNKNNMFFYIFFFFLVIQDDEDSISELMADKDKKSRFKLEKVGQVRRWNSVQSKT